MYASIQYGGKPAMLAIVREVTDSRRAKIDLGGFDVPLTQEQHKLVTVLRALLKEFFEGRKGG